MPGLVPGHPRPSRMAARKTWMAGTSSAKKRFALLPGHDETVIASQRVGAERRPMTGSAKQSMVARAKLDCFVRFAPRNDGFKIGELPSIRLHIVLGDDRIGREPLVHKTLFLQPAYLVADIFDVELAVGIDIGAVADHLLDRQIGVFGDDF